MWFCDPHVDRSAQAQRLTTSAAETFTLTARKPFIVLMLLMKACVFPDLEAVLSALAARRR